MTVPSHADIQQLSILDGHRLIALAVYPAEPEDIISAIYELALEPNDEEPSEPVLDANTRLTAVLPPEHAEDPLVFGSIDGEVIFADHEDVDAVPASDGAVSSLVDVDGSVVASTTKGEVLALVDGEVTSWKSEGPALHALALIAGTIWIAGDEGYLARREGESWKAVDTGTKHALRALLGTEHGVIAVGDAGTVVQLEGEKVTLRNAGKERLTAVASWSGRVLVAAGSEGLRELVADGSKVLREGRCDAVAADSKYLVIGAGEGALLVSEDGAIWRALAYAEPEPAEGHDHDHANCEHDHHH